MKITILFDHIVARLECPRAAHLLWDYAEERISEGPMEFVESHLRRCPSCRQEVESYRKAQSALFELRAQDPPDSRLGWQGLRHRIQMENSQTEMQPVYSLHTDRPSRIPMLALSGVVGSLALAGLVLRGPINTLFVHSQNRSGGAVALKDAKPQQRNSAATDMDNAGEMANAASESPSSMQEFLSLFAQPSSMIRNVSDAADTANTAQAKPAVHNVSMQHHGIASASSRKAHVSSSKRSTNASLASYHPDGAEGSPLEKTKASRGHEDRSDAGASAPQRQFVMGTIQPIPSDSDSIF